MAYKEYNNDFFSYQGSISRKNYFINMLILAALYIGLYFVKFENFEPYIPYKMIFSILIFMVSLFKFVILMSGLSVIYRRIADFSTGKTYNFNLLMKRLFIFLFVFPILYLFCIRYFIDIIPVLTNILDLITIFILIPAGIIAAVVFCFIKGN